MLSLQESNIFICRCPANPARPCKFRQIERPIIVQGNKQHFPEKILDNPVKKDIIIKPVRTDGYPCSRRDRGPNDQKEVQPWQKQAKSTK